MSWVIYGKERIITNEPFVFIPKAIPSMYDIWFFILNLSIEILAKRNNSLALSIACDTW